MSMNFIVRLYYVLLTEGIVTTQMGFVFLEICQIKCLD